jgi:hypothetical protein
MVRCRRTCQIHPRCTDLGGESRAARVKPLLSRSLPYDYDRMVTSARDSEIPPALVKHLFMSRSEETTQ